MKRRLTKIAIKPYWYLDSNGNQIEGAHGSIYGNLSNVRGDLTGVWGDLSGVWGNLSNVRGDLTGVRGNIDDCKLTDKDRERGVDVNDLIVK